MTRWRSFLEDLSTLLSQLLGALALTCEYARWVRTSRPEGVFLPDARPDGYRDLDMAAFDRLLELVRRGDGTALDTVKMLWRALQDNRTAQVYVEKLAARERLAKRIDELLSYLWGGFIPKISVPMLALLVLATCAAYYRVLSRWRERTPARQMAVHALSWPALATAAWAADLDLADLAFWMCVLLPWGMLMTSVVVIGLEGVFGKKRGTTEQRWSLDEKKGKNVLGYS